MRPAHAQLEVDDLTATADGQTQIDLAWTAPTITNPRISINGYVIEMSPSGTEGTWTTLVAHTGSTATTYSHKRLTGGTTRYYRMPGVWLNVNSGGAIPLTSNVASATTDAATAPESTAASTGHIGRDAAFSYDLLDPTTNINRKQRLILYRKQDGTLRPDSVLIQGALAAIANAQLTNRSNKFGYLMRHPTAAN